MSCVPTRACNASQAPLISPHAGRMSAPQRSSIARWMLGSTHGSRSGPPRMRTTIVIVGAAFLALSAPMSAGQSTPFRLTAVHRNLSYVTNGHPRQTLDLYLPTPPAVRTLEKPPANGYQMKLPLVIWMHGGAFFIGSKDDTVPLELLSQGYAVASIGYRLSGDAKFPAQVEDCKAAVRWLRANAARFLL